MPRIGDIGSATVHRSARELAHAIALVAMLLLAAFAAPVHAQRRDAPLPPRLDRPTVPAVPTPIPTNVAPLPELEDSAPAPATAAGGLVRPPNAARLAPLPGDRGRSSDIEEIVVVGAGNWRLPDLGSAWRARQKEAEEGDGPHLTVLPLYDPERPTTMVESPWILNREYTRIGYIDLFRLRFGRRGGSQDKE